MLKFIQSRLLLAAIRDSRVEGLAKKYSMTPETIRQLGDMVDPSANGTFTEWIIKQFIARKATLAYVWDGEAIKEALVKFIRLKNSPIFAREGNSTDINSYKMPEFVTQMSEIEKNMLSKKEQKREVLREKAKYLSEGCEFLGKVGPYHCYKVTTPEAATLMGTDTHWCTQSPSHSTSYLRGGPLFVFTQEKAEESGEKEFKNSYGSDKVFQFYFNSHRIECQDAEGEELDIFLDAYPDDSDQPYVVDDSLWPLFEFVAQFNPQAASYIKKKQLLPKSQITYYECGWCGETKPGKPGHNTSDGIFCCDDCYESYRRSVIKDEVQALLEGSVDEQSIQEGEEDFNELINSPNSEFAGFFKALRDLVEVKAPVNPSTGQPYKWPSNIEEIRAALENSGSNLNFLGMLIYNLEQFNKVRAETLLTYSPLFTRETADAALNKLKRIEKFLKPSMERIDRIVERFIWEGLGAHEVKETLEKWGEIPMDNVIEGEVVPHTSGWLLPDKTFVDRLDRSHKNASRSGWIEANCSSEFVEFKANRLTLDTFKHIQSFLKKNASWQRSKLIKIQANNQFWEVKPNTFMSAKTIKELSTAFSN